MISSARYYEYCHNVDRHEEYFRPFEHFREGFPRVLCVSVCVRRAGVIFKWVCSAFKVARTLFGHTDGYGSVRNLHTSGRGHSMFRGVAVSGYETATFYCRIASFEFFVYFMFLAM